MVLNEELLLKAEPNDLCHLCWNSHLFIWLNLNHIHINMEWLKPPLILEKSKHFFSTCSLQVSQLSCLLSQCLPVHFPLFTGSWFNLPPFPFHYYPLITSPYLYSLLPKPAINSFPPRSPVFCSFHSFPLSLVALLPHYYIHLPRDHYSCLSDFLILFCVPMFCVHIHNVM